MPFSRWMPHRTYNPFSLFPDMCNPQSHTMVNTGLFKLLYLSDNIFRKFPFRKHKPHT